MKKLYTTLFLTLMYIGVNAQAPNWAWAKSAGGTRSDSPKSCSTDASGNTFVVGNFYSSSITFGTTILTNTSDDTSEIFVVKYDPNGNVLWAKSAVGNDDDEVQSCSTDTNGNIVITGFFRSSSITFGTTTVANSYIGFEDIFIAKYDPNGNVLWAKSAGGTHSDFAYSCNTEVSGNIIVTGFFESSIISFGTTTVTNSFSGSLDIFIVKYDPNGNVLWANSAGGTASEWAYSCSTDTSDNTFVVGDFDSPSITFGTTTLVNAGNEIFIVKYDPSGNALWAKSADSCHARSCSTDASGNIIVAGWFQSSSITFGTTTLVNDSAGFGDDIFIAKYDPIGNVLWAKSAGGNSWDNTSCCRTDAAGNIIVTGSFASPSITFGTTTLTNAGSSNTFIVKYDPNGNVLWAKSSGGAYNDAASGCSFDANDNIIVAGNFNNPSIAFGTSTLVNAGSWDMYVAKLNGTTGIEEFNSENLISIYPNPTTTSFTITSSEKIKEIKVFNLLGEVVWQNNYHNVTTATIDFTSNISSPPGRSGGAGIYFVEVKTENGVVRKKVVKE